MSKEESLLSFYSTSLSDRFIKLAKPLDECFSLNGFFYSVTTPEGYGFQVSNRPDVSQAYFSNQLYQTNPLICHPDNYYHDQVLITADYHQQPFFQSYKQSLIAIKESFGFENYLCLYKKEKSFAHIFMFSSDKTNCPLNTLFLKNRNALLRFGDYFLKEWKNDSKKMDSFMINLGELMPSVYFKNHSSLQLNDNKKAMEKLLHKMGILDNFTNINFTRREKDCIENLLKGKTASQVAESLGIHQRTAEHYIDNIKSKLNCYSKNETIELLLELKDFNLL